MIQSNNQCDAHRERNLRQYAHHSEALFYKFTSIEALHWTLFLGNIDARGWELHLRYPGDKAIEPIYIFHGVSFLQVCEAGDMGIVKAMVERTHVDLEARDNEDGTPYICG